MTYTAESLKVDSKYLDSRGKLRYKIINAREDESKRKIGRHNQDNNIQGRQQDERLKYLSPRIRGKHLKSNETLNPFYSLAFGFTAYCDRAEK
jgi:hypothetical protein